MFKSIHGEDSLDDNNWYEFVEYGTTNKLTVFLQRNGFSRESANYIKDHATVYVIDCDGVLFLSQKLLNCNNTDVRSEAAIINLNRPGLFIAEKTKIPIDDIYAIEGDSFNDLE